MSGNKYDVGDVAVLIGEVRAAPAGNETVGALVDPGAVTVKIRTPAGIETSHAATRVSVGLYRYELFVAESGVYHYRFFGTEPARAAAEEWLEGRRSAFTAPI